MVGGVPRYYQLAACFRDEDPRADRLYGEFYQLDLEMSFAENGEEVRTEVEPLMKQLATDFAGKKLLDLSDLAVGDGNSIPRISYRDAMETYGSDKPDLRFGMELIELTDVFSETEFGVFKNAECVKAICVKNGASLSRKQIDNFTNIAKSEGAGGLAYITYQDGEVKSPITKFLSEKELADIQQKTGAVDGDAVFFGADSRSVVNAVLGRLRNEFANRPFSLAISLVEIELYLCPTLTLVRASLVWIFLIATLTELQFRSSVFIISESAVASTD
jgi:aspartyl-tRNA synthetase